MSPRSLGIAVVVLHALVLALHDRAHRALPVPLTDAQTLFAYTVIVLAPLVAGFLLWRGRLAAGGALLAASMLGSLVFGVVNHYVIESPDHVSAIPATDWGSAFVWSALAMALVEGAGIVAGWLAWRSGTPASAAA